VDPKARQVVTGFLAEGKKHGSHHDPHSALAIRNEGNFQTLSPERKKEIENWVADMAEVAGRSPERILEAVLIPGHDKRISPVLVQLSAFILRNYLASHQITMEYANLRDFMEGMMVEIVKSLAGKRTKRLEHHNG
jgi:hypothetical protein